MDINKHFLKFREKCKSKNLEANDCGNGHWQVIGGKLLVNYYPFARRGATVYVAGSKNSCKGSDDVAISSALGSIKKVDGDYRKKTGYTKFKIRMLKKNPFCHWCKCSLDHKTATVNHKVPLALGGMNNPNNYVLACKECNSEKANKIW